MALSDEQRKFVLAPPDAHQSMQSWAGTGKTHTLIERVHYLLTAHNVMPESMIVTTFTVEGARECQKRLRDRMGCECGVRIGTMDSLASQWMRLFFEPEGYYTGIQEFGTLLLDFLKSPGGNRIKKQVKYLIVDEFQDLSRTQLDTVMEFYRAGTRILAIGDVAQNIYEWRGCHGHFLSSLAQRIPEMQEFHLTVNRRCTPEIIAAGNSSLRFLKQPDHRLMQHVRPSAGVKPIIDTVDSGRPLGAHVLRIMRYYHTMLGIAYGDMAVIGRFKHGLFAVEEALIKANRFAKDERDVVPFVTSASVGTVDKNPRRRDGHVTLTTSHQSKGLEWPVVIALLWNPNMLDEEMRLMYVTQTRARDRLHIVSQSDSTTGSFAKHVDDLSLYVLPDGTPFVNVMSKPVHAYVSKRTDRSTGVCDLIRSLTCEQIQEMRTESLIPLTRGEVKAAPGCKIRTYRFQRDTQKFAEIPDSECPEVEEDDDDVEANGLHIEFGNFVDRYITRLFWLNLKEDHEENLTDRDAMHLLETVFVSKAQSDACDRYEVALSEFLLGKNHGEILQELIDCGAESDDVKCLAGTFNKISVHCQNVGIDRSKARVSNGKPFMTLKELLHLRASYEKFSCKAVPQKEAMFHIFKVSLCSVIIAGRKSMWFHPDAYMWFRRKLNYMMPCISRFMTDVLADKEAVIKPSFTFGVIAGEADLLTSTSVIDYKCSKRMHDFSWLGQGIAYMAMACSDKLNKLLIFNPLMQSIWEYDCSEWTMETRGAFMDYLLRIAVELRRQQSKI